ncbi:hypothetical protein [Amycolatopsis sp. CA-230715]|uniref:hypothetical protein n=1 Tax=Amycolatopsis sp. CA-230715 TaxID=2745196 RepID=UPI001C00C22F|nr:hypothetical protein [Amycolatopsis sp. CA-230715]QWF85722.1 hypothetical protein HUW46_09202 [Amycolatopsis sp. CA-230715]
MSVHPDSPHKAEEKQPGAIDLADDKSAVKSVSALSDKHRERLAEALRAAESAVRHGRILLEIRQVLAEDYPYRDVPPVGAVFRTAEEPNGFFFTRFGDVVFADGQIGDDVAFGSPVEELFTDEFGGAQGRHTVLVVNLRDDTIGTDGDDERSIHARFGVSRTPSDAGADVGDNEVTSQSHRVVPNDGVLTNRDSDESGSSTAAYDWEDALGDLPIDVEAMALDRVLGAVANTRVRGGAGGYVLRGENVDEPVDAVKSLGLVRDSADPLRGDPHGYRVLELTAAGRMIVEQVHPFKWRAVCRHCGTPLSRSHWADRWLVRTLHGAHEECEKAPTVDGDPGHHDPLVAVSRNGVIDDGREQLTGP